MILIESPDKYVFGPDRILTGFQERLYKQELIVLHRTHTGCYCGFDACNPTFTEARYMP